MMEFITTNICLEIKLKWSAPISEGLVEYSDGTQVNNSTNGKRCNNILSLGLLNLILESQHRMGFKAIIYLIILLTLVYMSKQKVWSRFGSKKEPEEETLIKLKEL